jgi:hypothetical protein
MELGRARPALVQKLLLSLVESVGKRLLRLQPAYRNYILFGYLPEHTLPAELALLKRKPFHPTVYGLLGGTYGFFVGLVIAIVMGQSYPGLASAIGPLAVACEISVILCAGAGFITGVFINHIRGEEGLESRSDRNCGNCRFIAWDQKQEHFHCLLLMTGAASPGIRTGKHADTYTDCKAFEIVHFGQAESRRRDSLQG